MRLSRAVLPALVASLSLAAAASAAPQNVVISEFRTRGPAGGNDEFVELLNSGASPVNIAGSGTHATRAAVAQATAFLRKALHGA